MPRFISPLLSLKLTAKHMGILTYTHGALTNGMTTRGRLLGDELGPDAKAFGAQLTWQPTPAAGWASTAARDLQQCGVPVVLRRREQLRYVVRKVSRTSDELRDRVGAALLMQSEAGPAFSLRFVTERARNYLFQGGAQRTPRRSSRCTCCSSTHRTGARRAGL